MGAVYFYHLTRSPVEDTLPMLLEKAMGAGWRILVRGQDAGRMDLLDEKLWTRSEEGFLPHGRRGGAHDARQPVLLDHQPNSAEAFQCLMSVDGAGFEPGEAASLDRICVLFDGNDADAVQTARVQWKSTTDAGIEAQYWAQEGTRWTKKATANATE